MSDTDGKASLTCLLAIAEVEASTLEEENDTMRHQLADVTESMGRVEERCAKLRELVKDTLRNMHGCTFHHSCGSCDYEECIYEARARELGIEVGE